jgi:type I restriction enzyme S subunit
MLFRTNPHEAVPNFLLTLLNSDGIKNIVFGKIIGAAAPRVNVKDLKELYIIKPPVELQKNYELIALKYRRIRHQSQEQLNFSSRTFESLTQRAFQGKL